MEIISGGHFDRLEKEVEETAKDNHEWTERCYKICDNFWDWALESVGLHHLPKRTIRNIKMYVIINTDDDAERGYENAFCTLQDLADIIHDVLNYKVSKDL